MGKIRTKIGAGESDDGAAFEGELAAGESHFQGGRIFRIAHQEVGGAESEGIGGTRGGDAVLGETEAAEILHGGEEAGGEDVQAGQARASREGRKRMRSPIRRRGGGEAARSKRLSVVRPMRRQPPGEASG